MKNTKENNIQKSLWHIKRHYDKIQNTPEDKICNHDLFHLQSSVDCLKLIAMKNLTHGWTGMKYFEHFVKL